jgi:hypothetical protein
MRHSVRFRMELDRRTVPHFAWHNAYISNYKQAEPTVLILKE